MNLERRPCGTTAYGTLYLNGVQGVVSSNLTVPTTKPPKHSHPAQPDTRIVASGQRQPGEKPGEGYRTIVADPPWPYNLAGTGLFARTPKVDGTPSRKVQDTGYGLMGLDEILALKPPAAGDAHLYLWTTNAFMREAHGVAEAWGFKVKTILTWVKTRASDGQPSMKTGYYFRGATEHVLFAVRGSLPLQTNDALPTAFLWPRIGRHSEKPEAFYDLVEQASPGPYLEMFARRNRLGWDTWGNECFEHVTVAPSHREAVRLGTDLTVSRPEEVGHGFDD